MPLRCLDTCDNTLNRLYCCYASTHATKLQAGRTVVKSCSNRLSNLVPTDCQILFRHTVKSCSIILSNLVSTEFGHQNHFLVVEDFAPQPSSIQWYLQQFTRHIKTKYFLDFGTLSPSFASRPCSGTQVTTNSCSQPHNAAIQTRLVYRLAYRAHRFTGWHVFCIRSFMLQCK